MLFPILLALVAAAEAHPTQHTHSLNKRASYPDGIATFNNYAAQGNTNCGPSSGKGGTYGAAASDISPGISGGTCSGSILMSQCSGQSAVAGYAAPGCPKSNCGKCYKVTNIGGIGGSIGGQGNSITVQIIDACPATSAYNFCKTEMPINQRCGDPSTNQLDIDISAYMALTGQPHGGGPNLNIAIEDSDCSGATSAGDSNPSSASPAAPVQSSSTSSTSDLSPGLPGQHSAAGDKEEQRVAEGSLNHLEPGAPDGVPQSQPLSSSSSSSTYTSSPSPSTTSPVPPPSSSVSSPGSPEGGVSIVQGAGKHEEQVADDDEECDEL